MGEVYCRRVVAEVRGKKCDLSLFVKFLAEGDDVEAGKIQVEATDCKDYWRTETALCADDLSKTLASGRLRTALEALTHKFRTSRDFEYTIDDENTLHIRFHAGKTKNRLRVKLHPHPTPAPMIAAALGGLGANIRRLSTAVDALSKQDADLRSLADWSADIRVTVEVDGPSARAVEYQGGAEMLLEKIRELRVAEGMSEEPEEEVDEVLIAEGGVSAVEAGEEDLRPITKSEAEERRSVSPDPGEETVGLVEEEEPDVEVTLLGEEEGNENIKGKIAG